MVHERTQRARHDLDWLPPSFKAIRWTVAGTLWAGMAAGFVAMVAKSEIIFFGKGIAVLAAGGYYAGDRAAKAVLRGRLQRLARGAVDLRGLHRETDGELMHVRGQVKAQETLGGLLDGGARAVYRRVVFTIGTDRWVHEAGCDFQLVDESGERAIVEVEGARLIAADPKRRRVAPESASLLRNLAMGLPPDALSELPAFQKGSLKRRQRLVVTAGERLLRDGDTVEVVGYKSRRVDPTIAERLARETPMRATLRAGKSLPLLLAPST